jgi:DNA-binding IclR family transcriptional regulator
VRHQNRVTSRVGSRVPINWTASGRLLVGHLTAVKRVAFFAKHVKPSPTGRAETDPRKLSQASAAALAQRLSVQIGESDASVACLAAPVVNPLGECMITISIVLPEAKAMNPERYTRAVRAAAERIERRLGWRATAERRAA